jgi:hypothetical protein
MTIGLWESAAADVVGVLDGWVCGLVGGVSVV